jgi:hypothetical protein
MKTAISIPDSLFREAERLTKDGCAYLCGYVVELALKARICALLGVEEYPDKGSRLRDALRTHDFDDLRLLAGMEHEFTATHPALLSNWSIASKWKPERRYDPPGSYDRVEAERILDAIRGKPEGVLGYLHAGS